MRFSWRLQGLSDRWSGPTQLALANFTNVPPGHHTFEVKAISDDGLESPVTRFYIHIESPYWATWWFRLLGLAAIGGIFYTIFRYRKILRLRQEQLRQRIARDLHDEMGSTLSTISILSASTLHGVQKDLDQARFGNIGDNATELCDGLDNDCDGQVDEDVTLTFYADTDGYGYGDPSATTQACTVPSGYVADNTDCDDDEAAIHPNAAELCDGLDNDCDGNVDEGIGPVYIGDFSFSTQAELDAFPPCYTSLDGSITISGGDIVSLSPLSNLTEISGFLHISSNPLLPNLTGLSSLLSVTASFEIYDNPLLTDLAGLESLESTDDYITIQANEALQNMTGLTNLVSIGGSLQIYDNPVLVNLSGLGNLASITGDLNMAGNADLQDLSGLEGLNSIGQYFYANDNLSLTNVDALSNLIVVNAGINIGGNPNLLSLSGLSGVGTTGDLQIYDNDALLGLDGLDGLTSLTSIGIYDNLLLDNLNALSNLSGTIHAIYISGNTETCTFTVTLKDVTPPTITCPTNIVRSSDPGFNTAVVTYTDPAFSDNCSGSSIAIVPPGLPSGSTFPQGITSVIWQATDGVGLTQRCTFTVTVTTAQTCTIVCPGNLVRGTDPGLCTAVVTYTTPTFVDNCPGGSIALLSGLPSGSSFPKGATSVEWQATDGSGFTQQCTFIVTVNDTQAPSTICPANIVRGTGAGQCTAAVTYPTPTFSDNCTGGSVAIVPPSLPSGSTFQKGVTSVIWQVTDGAGLTQRCTFTVTVNDGQPPSIVCPANLVRNTDAGQCSAVVTYASPTFSDNCPGTTIQRTGGPASGTAFQKGIQTVNWQATDAAGLTAVCNFTVTVNDGQAPTITCPANLNKTTNANLCTAVVTYITPLMTDNCTPAGTLVLMSGLPSGSTFPKGASTIVWKATDSAGLTETCSFTITVSDGQLPAITCPANQTKGTDPNLCTAVVAYTTPTATDNCSPGPTVAIQSGLASGQAFSKGITTVVWRATDAAGLVKTCTFRVTVNDAQAPTITCPPSIATGTDPGSCSAVETYSPATFTDNCPGGSILRISGLASGSVFPKGTNNVTWKATDASGLVQICTFQGIVTDAQLPSISCPPNISMIAPPGQCSATVTYPNPNATDNCTIQSLYLFSGLSSGSLFPQGVTTNTWRASDNSGLSATCAFTVTVSCGTQNSEQVAVRNEEFEVRSLKFEVRKKDNEQLITMNLTPNPATTQVEVWVEGLNENGGTLTVSDAQGRVIRQLSIADREHSTVDLWDFAAGMYFVTLRSSGRVVTKWVMVSKL